MRMPAVARIAPLRPSPRARAWPVDVPRIAAIDVETTGLDPANDRVVEIAIVLDESHGVVARHGWLVDPERPIPSGASRVHGITDRDVRGAPSFRALAPTILRLLRGAGPLAYNAPFDRGFLHAELARAGVARSRLPEKVVEPTAWLDPLRLARARLPQLPSRRLHEVAAVLGLPARRAHRALGDAETALAVFLRLSGSS